MKSGYRVRGYKNLKYFKTEANSIVNHMNPVERSFVSPLRSYRAYSKAKSQIRSNNISPRPKPFLQPISIPELAITPEYLSMIKYFSEKMNQNFKIPLVGLQKLPNLKPKINLIPANPQPVLINSSLKSKRKVILSRTPDPWKKLENVNKVENDDSDSEKRLVNTYDY